CDAGDLAGQHGRGPYHATVCRTAHRRVDTSSARPLRSSSNFTLLLHRQTERTADSPRLFKGFWPGNADLPSSNVRSVRFGEKCAQTQLLAIPLGESRHRRLTVPFNSPHDSTLS